MQEFRQEHSIYYKYSLQGLQKKELSQGTRQTLMLEREEIKVKL